MLTKVRMVVMDDRLIRDLRVPKMNASSTMAEAADEIERLRALITEWYEAECAELRHFPPGLEAMTRASKAREALFKETV